MIRFKYEMEDGEYKLTEVGDEHEYVLSRSKEVMISYIKDDDGINKIMYHGEPRAVSILTEQVKLSLLEAGQEKSIKKIATICGTPDTEQLNRAIVDPTFFDTLAKGANVSHMVEHKEPKKQTEQTEEPLNPKKGEADEHPTH